MALPPAASEPNAAIPRRNRVGLIGRTGALAWAAFLTLVVAGPWLLPGFIFGTDWPGPVHFPLPTAPDSSTLLRVALSGLAWVFGGEATGKVLVLGSLFAAGALAYRALPKGDFVPRAVAAAIYVVNPFVYGRLHYGQLFLLGAYAVFPWAAVQYRMLLLRPGVATALASATAFALIGIFSPHVLLIAALLAATLLAAHAMTADNKVEYLRGLTPWFALSVGVTVVGSAYWLVPLVIGRGPEAGVVAGTGVGDLHAYAAVPDQSLGLVPNLLGLYGFWAENSGRFASMKAFAPAWALALVLLLVLVVIGAAATYKERCWSRSAWVVGLLVAGAIALPLEMGVSHPLTATVVTWLDAHVVIYRGMRDAGKWAVLLAFLYSQLVGLGAAALGALRKAVRDPTRAELVGAVTTGLLLALPLYYGNGLLFGAHGEIRPSQYPAGWYAAERVLATDSHPGRALFLPWHEYMSYSFVLNQNRVVAPPAPSFFSVPMLVSANPEVPGVEPPHSPDQDAVAGLVRDGSSGQWAQILSASHIKYVFLARELDWTYFKFLDDQPGLTKVGDFGSIVLYRIDGAF
jgi:hypothetical protein